MSEKKLLKNLQDATKDWSETRLAYAKWLDARDDIRGEFLRLQVEIKTGRMLPAKKRKARKRLEAMESELDREWLKQVTFLPAVKYDRGWSVWISLETLKEYKVKDHIPLNAIVISKYSETVFVNAARRGFNRVGASFGVAKVNGVEWLRKKNNATELLFDAIEKYLDRHEMFPPNLAITKKFRNGNYELTYSPNKYDQFTFSFKSSWFEDIHDYFDCLEKYDPDREPNEWLTREPTR